MNATTAAPEAREIGGRRFVPIGPITTAERDHWVMGQVRTAGLDIIVRRDDEGAEEFGRRLLGEVLASGLSFELLGAFLLPVEPGAESADPLAWTPHLAIETGAFLRKVSAPEDKQAVNDLLLSMLMDFFESGMSSLWSSPRPSPATAGAGQPESESAHAATMSTGNGAG